MKRNHYLGAGFGLCILLSSNVYAQENVLPDNGNVGIGTTNPTEKLQVHGSAKIDSMLVVQDSMIVRKGTVMEDNLSVEGDFKLSGNGYFNQPIYYSNYQPLDPTATNLKLFGTDESGMLKSITVGEAVQGKCVTTLMGGYLPSWKNGENKIYVDCPGTHVGINTTNPAHNLHIVGSQFTTGSHGIGEEPDLDIKLKLRASTAETALQINANFPVGNQTHHKLLELNASNIADEVIRVNNLQYNFTPFQLQASGKLIISNQTQRIFQIDPDGLVHSRKIKVDVLSNWPDYVFQPEYNLMPIEDVKTFIEIEKHLPGVPSAIEMKENGMDIAETNKIMMEKLEELMLYILQQQEEIKKLEVQIEELNKSLEKQ